jgi:superfamily II DNA or RNA helicase
VSTDTAAPERRPLPFDLLVELEASGDAKPEQLEVLHAEPEVWRDLLEQLIIDTERGLTAVEALTGPERDQVVADFDSRRLALRSSLARLTGEPDPVLDAQRAASGLAPIEMNDPSILGVRALQTSWSPGHVVIWAAGPEVAAAGYDDLRAMLEGAGAPTAPFAPHAPVALPDGTFADALVAPIGDILGWLVATGAESARQADAEAAAAAGQAAAPSVVGGLAPTVPIGASLRWLGGVAIWAVHLTMQGSVVPLVKQRQRNRRGNDGGGSYTVRWAPALVDPARMKAVAGAMPGAVTAIDTGVDARAVTRSALTGMVDAICRDAAKRVEVPAAPPRPRTSSDVAEAFLGRLDGSQFDAPARLGSELVGDLERWAKPVTNQNLVRLIVQLDAPDEGGAWNLAVLAPAKGNRLQSVEVAMVNAGQQRESLEQQLTRLERLLPALRRPGGNRRGEVVLSQAEAWELMTETGAVLVSAGFDVRVPALSLRRATPSLRMSADPQTQSVVGAQQLANVRWSALFDDVELTAADITRLAAEARPLVRSKGRWIELDHADLKAAAAALAERSSATQLSGAEMLRHALGLEGSPLAGGITIEGSGWAADLLARASTVSTEPAPAPDGFVGELRSYQGEALAWLGFLDSADLGGCLALDMGLGKTPTMLAHLQATAGGGPALVIAPPAVVGNWAAEARRFTPDLKVVVHHGAGRAGGHRIEREVAKADVVISTYGTAVRDIDDLEKITWDRIVLDEAQAIKNPANDTAQQLRRLPARSRIALTGTPIENGLGDLHSILDFTNPGLVGPRNPFIAQLSAGGGDGEGRKGEGALRALNGILVFRRTKDEPAIAAELPDRIDELDHCAMTPEQIGLYQAVLDSLVTGAGSEEQEARKGQVLAAITALKQICNHPAAYHHDGSPLEGRSGKLARLEEIVDSVYAAGERVLVFTHFAEWGQRLAEHLTERTGTPVSCYHGGLSRTARDEIINSFQNGKGPGALVLSLKAGGTGLNLTAASHVVLYDRWWNPAVEDQARDRAWRIGQTRTVISHRLVCPGTVDERVEEVVAGKRRIAELVLPKSSSLADLDADQLRVALGLRTDELLTEDDVEVPA